MRSWSHARLHPRGQNANGGVGEPQKDICGHHENFNFVKSWTTFNRGKCQSEAIAWRSRSCVTPSSRSMLQICLGGIAPQFNRPRKGESSLLWSLVDTTSRRKSHLNEEQCTRTHALFELGWSWDDCVRCLWSDGGKEYLLSHYRFEPRPYNTPSTYCLINHMENLKLYVNFYMVLHCIV